MIRIGSGYDLHRLVEGRPFILGGQLLPHARGLDGHSDADVLAHAITDALLGALALGNIGTHFPDTDPAYKDADSMALLRQTYALVREQGYVLGNLDATIVAEAPKLNPHIPAIQQALATLFAVEKNRISIKAKTNEGVGPEGREEAVSCQALVLLFDSAGGSAR